MPKCELPGCENRDELQLCGDCDLGVCGEHWNDASEPICLSCAGRMPICEIRRCNNSREILRVCYLCDRAVCSNHWIEPTDEEDGDLCSRCLVNNN